MTDAKEWVASLPQTTPSPLQRYRECCCAEPDDRGSYYDAGAIDKLREDDLNELQRLAAEAAAEWRNSDHVLRNEAERLREQCRSARELLTNIEASQGSLHLPGLLRRAIRCFLADAS